MGFGYGKLHYDDPEKNAFYSKYDYNNRALGYMVGLGLELKYRIEKKESKQ